MKVLNAMETEMVSGGGDLTCDNPNAASNIDGLGKKAAEEIWSFIDNVTMPIRDFGSDFGIWLYNMTHSC